MVQVVVFTNIWYFNWFPSSLLSLVFYAEMYGDRLAEGGEEKLKVHCYRALLEQLLVARDPGLRHTQLRTVAQAHKMDFPSYARQLNIGTAAGSPGSRAEEDVLVHLSCVTVSPIPRLVDS